MYISIVVCIRILVSFMKITKAVLTGGGRATRLRPITITINKHLIPLANKPMIFHAIEKVVEAGISEVFINVNPGEKELQRVVGNGERWGIKISYFEQEGGPQGVAHVVKQAQKFIGNDPFLFYLSDNIILGSIKDFIKKFEDGSYDCMLALSEVPDPQRFGVPIFDENKNLIDVVEKPEKPSNSFAVTGIYIYGSDLFFKTFDKIEKSARGEYEISSIHSLLIKGGYKVGYKEITGWWKDTGKPEDLILANNLLLEELKEENFKNVSEIKCDAQGKVHIDEGVKIGNSVKIVGPAIIGKNCELENCTVGPNVTIGSGTKIVNSSVSESIIFSNCQIEAGNFSKSIIGESAKVRKNGKENVYRLIVGDHTLIEV